MWITGGNSGKWDPVNIDQAITLVGGRVDGDHYGVYAIFKFGSKWDAHEKVLLVQTTHNEELDGNTGNDWAAFEITKILNAIEKGQKVYRFPK